MLKTSLQWLRRISPQASDWAKRGPGEPRRRFAYFAAEGKVTRAYGAEYSQTAWKADKGAFGGTIRRKAPPVPPAKTNSASASQRDKGAYILCGTTLLAPKNGAAQSRDITVTPGGAYWGQRRETRRPRWGRCSKGIFPPRRVLRPSTKTGGSLWGPRGVLVLIHAVFQISDTILSLISRFVNHFSREMGPGQEKTGAKSGKGSHRHKADGAHHRVDQL